MKTTVRTQKMIRVGNSYGVSLDAGFLQNQAITTGDSFIVRYSEDGVVTLFPAKTLQKLAKNLDGTQEEKAIQVASQINPELVEWTKNFIAENKEALDELAHL